MAATKPVTMDRRVARTRKTLQHALLALMLKKGYDAITVEDICAAADVGRSTFYAHFTGKEALKRSGLDDHLRKMLIERQREAKTAGKANGESFAFALVSKGGAQTTLKMMRQVVTDLVRRELAETAAPDGAPREAVVQFVVGAFMALLTWWLDGGAKLPAQRMDALFRRLTMDGVA